MQQSRSVGRIEFRAQNGRFPLLGTGFVIKRGRMFGLIATNCHVIRSLLTAPPDPRTGAPAPNNLEISFGDSPIHDDTQSFRIKQILPCPGKGLDVAFLYTELYSRSNNTPLPDGLNLLPTGFFPTQAEVEMGVIGYPQLSSAKPNDYYSSVFARFDKTKYSKFYCPGQIKDHTIDAGSDFLLHVASTMAGQSGSPMLRLQDGLVVGVDACCTFPDGKPPAADADQLRILPCSLRTIPAFKNIAVSSWTVSSDPVLGKLLSSSF